VQSSGVKEPVNVV